MVQRTAWAGILLGCGAALALTACEIDQTEEGELPQVDVDVEEGRLPEFDVEGPDVEIAQRERTITVPDVDVDVEREERTITVPDVDIDFPDEDGDDPATADDANPADAPADARE